MAEFVLDCNVIEVEQPTAPAFTAVLPSQPDVLVLPVPGPAGIGAPGPPGPTGPAGDAAAITTHITDPTPHPTYDDLPSLALIFENGLI